MRIEIKLYSYHDLDLVSLYKTGRIAFPETTRQVLNSYARKEVYKVRPLPLNENRAAKYPQKMYRKFYHYHVDLDSKEDADAIRLMRTITDGYRNNFIKSVLRQYLCGIFTEEYSKNGDARFFNEMSRRIQGDRDEKDIKQVKRNKGNKKYQKNTSRKEAVYKESEKMPDETQLSAEKRISRNNRPRDNKHPVIYRKKVIFTNNIDNKHCGNNNCNNYQETNSTFFTIFSSHQYDPPLKNHRIG